VVVQRNALALLRQFLDAQPEMRADLSAFLLRTLRVDLTRVDGAVAWSSLLAASPTFAVYLRLPGAGTPRGQVLGQHAGTDLVAFGRLVAAAAPGGLLIGNESEVRAGLDAARSKGGARTPLGALLAADRAADLSLAVLAAGVADPGVQQLTQQFGVRALTMALRGSALVVEVSGDPQKLEGARNLIAGGFQVMLQKLRDEKDRAAAGDDVAAGVAAIAGYHSAARFWKEFQPRLQGDRLVSQYQIPEVKASNLLVGYLGVASAIAIPAFTKYVRRSKAAEATLNLRRIADGAAAHREQHRKDGKRFTFPSSTDWAPAAACCGQPGNRCGPSVAFDDPTWKALGFSVDGSHYFQYRFTSEGKGARARFVAEARGDLDCDGRFSTYRLSGGLDPKGALQRSPVQADNGLE